MQGNNWCYSSNVKLRVLFAALAELLPKHSYNLSRTLQYVNIMSAAEGQEVASLAVAALQSLRSDQDFDLFWCKISKAIESLDIYELSLPRRRRAPKYVEIGEDGPFYSSTPKEFYRRYYYKALDVLTSAISDRFDQAGYQTHRKTEDLLLKAAHGQDFSDEFEFVTDFYGDDFNSFQLRTQLNILGTLNC